MATTENRERQLTTPDLIWDMEERLRAIDREEESLKTERRRVSDALLALQGRKRPGRKPTAV